MSVQSPWVECFILGPIQMRCSVVTDRATGDTVIIDGGDEPQRLIDWIDGFSGQGPDWSNGPISKDQADSQVIPARRIVALINTHAHFDHSGHVPTLLQHYPVKWYLHPDDTFLQTLARSSAQRYGLEMPEPAVADIDLVDGEIVTVGSLSFEILHTPGHSLGGCCLRLLVDDGPDHVFVGDTLFAGSVGRTDIANSGGDFTVLAHSIHTKLWPLDPASLVYPGHGDTTTIGHEKATNPFVGDAAGAGSFTRGRFS